MLNTTPPAIGLIFGWLTSTPALTAQTPLTTQSHPPRNETKRMCGCRGLTRLSVKKPRLCHRHSGLPLTGSYPTAAHSVKRLPPAQGYTHTLKSKNRT